jgi:glutamine cyclotransferase
MNRDVWRCARPALLSGGLSSVLSVSFWLAASVAEAAPIVVPQIMQTLPHDASAFTQGLVLDEGQIFESTVLNGQSSLRRVTRDGQVQQSITLPDDEFGEGLALVGQRLVQLTWMNGIAHVYDQDSFELLEDFEYAGEGWGLCFDGARLVMSDGSDTLFFRDPDTFALLGSVPVRNDGVPVDNLNELECVGGAVFANVWLQDYILHIDPQTGEVLTQVDATLLRKAETAPSAEALNGIAHDPVSGHFLLTGKLWSTVFEVALPIDTGSGAPADGSCAVSPRFPATACPVGYAALASIGALVAFVGRRARWRRASTLLT